MTGIDSSIFTYLGVIRVKRIRRFDLLTTDLGHALVVYDLTQILAEDNQCVTKICSQQIETSYSFHSNRSKVSENTTINLILGAMNNIFHMTGIGW